jgi:GntR family transcriptional regulator/MocR family aminotransferase
VTLSAGRRIELLRMCRERRLALIEDDYDNEFHFDGPPRLPLAADDPGGCVCYIGTLSKVLAPGLRIGFVVAAPPVLARLATLRRFIDRQGDTLGERAVAELFADGEVRRHVLRMRRVYRRRRDHLVTLLRAHLPELAFDIPGGGMGLWVRGRADFTAWAERALAQGVAFAPASRFAFDVESLDGARLGYATLDEDRLEAAVRVLVKTR